MDDNLKIYNAVKKVPDEAKSQSAVADQGTHGAVRPLWNWMVLRGY